LDTLPLGYEVKINGIKGRNRLFGSQEKIWIFNEGQYDSRKVEGRRLYRANVQNSDMNKILYNEEL